MHAEHLQRWWIIGFGRIFRVDVVALEARAQRTIFVSRAENERLHTGVNKKHQRVRADTELFADQPFDVIRAFAIAFEQLQFDGKFCVEREAISPTSRAIKRKPIGVTRATAHDATLHRCRAGKFDAPERERDRAAVIESFVARFVFIEKRGQCDDARSHAAERQCFARADFIPRRVTAPPIKNRDQLAALEVGATRTRMHLRAQAIGGTIDVGATKNREVGARLVPRQFTTQRIGVAHDGATFRHVAAWRWVNLAAISLGGALCMTRVGDARDECAQRDDSTGDERGDERGVLHLRFSDVE